MIGNLAIEQSRDAISDDRSRHDMYHLILTQEIAFLLSQEVVNRDGMYFHFRMTTNR
jgi:hypothetical protein